MYHPFAHRFAFFVFIERVTSNYLLSILSHSFVIVSGSNVCKFVRISNDILPEIYIYIHTCVYTIRSVTAWFNHTGTAIGRFHRGVIAVLSSQSYYEAPRKQTVPYLQRVRLYIRRTMDRRDRSSLRRRGQRTSLIQLQWCRNSIEPLV